MGTMVDYTVADVLTAESSCESHSSALEYSVGTNQTMDQHYDKVTQLRLYTINNREAYSSQKKSALLTGRHQPLTGSVCHFWKRNTLVK